GPPLLSGNRVRPLLNGDEFFPAIFDLIARARTTVCVETYMWSSGGISDLFIETLTERARAGVRVLAISDGFGALKMNRDDANRLKKGGVEFVFYERARWTRIKSNLAHRTHRKIILIDGRIGVT